jgi:hypothetical protein
MFHGQFFLVVLKGSLQVGYTARIRRLFELLDFLYQNSHTYPERQSIGGSGNPLGSAWVIFDQFPIACQSRKSQLGLNYRDSF